MSTICFTHDVIEILTPAEPEIEDGYSPGWSRTWTVAPSSSIENGALAILVPGTWK
jgi:hypothetical protein